MMKKIITVLLPLWMLGKGLRKGVKGKFLGLYLDMHLVIQVYAFVKIQKMYPKICLSHLM